MGNPKRYGSKDVVRMDPVTTSGKRKLVDGDQDVETEGEKQLQAMARKQLNTSITLNEQIAQHRSFTSSGEYKPSVKTLYGVSRLDSYKEVLKEDSAVEELKKCGLTEGEIRLKLGSKEGRGSKHSYGLHPHVQEGKLEEINRRISDRDRSLHTPSPTAKPGVVEMGRRELEIEQRLIGDNSGARALSSFLTKQKVIKGDPNDPINQLPELLGDIEGKARMVKGTRWKHGHSVKDRKEKACVEEGGVSVSGTNVSVLDHDADFIGPLLPQEGTEEVVETPEGRSSPVPLVDEDGRRIVVDVVENVPEDVIRKYRLKLEEIRGLPRFENYTPGQPTNVLYLKNLSNKVTEEDLVSLFGRFQTDNGGKIVYRLMTGRMRGQAFVTFQDTATAASALQLCNGYHYRGKPIIIEYGRKSTGSVT